MGHHTMRSHLCVLGYQHRSKKVSVYDVGDFGVWGPLQECGLRNAGAVDEDIDWSNRGLRCMLVFRRILSPPRLGDPVVGGRGRGRERPPTSVISEAKTSFMDSL